MLSANNILSPATGRPITVPTQDMVFGAYYLTLSVEGEPGEGRFFRHAHEVEHAFEEGKVALHARITVRPSPGSSLYTAVARNLGLDPDSEEQIAIETTPGRLFFNEALPDGFSYVNDVVGRRNTGIGAIVEEIAATEPKNVVAESLDHIKALGFRYAAQSGLTISIDDVRTPPEKASILDRYEREAEKAETQFKRGVITDDERRQKEIEIWTSATSEVGRAMEKTLSAMAFNPLDMMVDSGARGNSQQIRQIAGMKGLVSNPRGEMIPRPIKSSFREGLSVLEYFISTHGARKGLADTALRTADSGYLTRRLVDVAQELIIKIDDCETARGVWLDDVVPDEAGKRSYLETRAYGRILDRPRQAVEQGDRRGRDHTHRRDRRAVARRPGGGSRPGPLGPDVRVRARGVCRLLRAVARYRQIDRARRGRRCYRRPVHRRAGDTADDAYLPHGRNRR